MNLEIHKPELVKRVNAQIQSGHFHNTDELIERLLTPLTNRQAPRCRRRQPVRWCSQPYRLHLIGTLI